MTTLHMANKSPFERTALVSCLRHMSEGDAVLMIEDAVIGARKGAASVTMLEDAMKKGTVYILSADLSARGIASEQIVPGTQIVDYGGFVDLVTQHERTVSWL